MAESPRVTGIKIVLRHGQFFGVGIEAVPVGADFIDRHDVADVFAVEITSIASVTARTVLCVNFFALRTELHIDRKRIFGRLFCKEPLLYARELLQVNCGRECAGAECGALVALLHQTVISVPVRMKVFLFAQTLQPDGRKIAKANQLARFEFFQWKF